MRIRDEDLLDTLARVLKPENALLNEEEKSMIAAAFEEDYSPELRPSLAGYKLFEGLERWKEIYFINDAAYNILIDHLSDNDVSHLYYDVPASNQGE